MAEQAAKDDAARKRIISHMNKDHHDSIVRYLEHYSKLPSWRAYDGSIADINLNVMALKCIGKRYQIPFDPPMKSLSEARERVVQMDKYCLQALEKSDVTVKEFVPPTGLYALEFAIIAATFLAYSQRWWFARGAIVERLLGSNFARFSWTIQPWLITFMLGLHAAEAFYLARNQLRRHSVNIRTTIWWQWIVFTFVEGQFAFKRFNDLVAHKTEEKKKQKH